MEAAAGERVSVIVTVVVIVAAEIGGILGKAVAHQVLAAAGRDLPRGVSETVEEQTQGSPSKSKTPPEPTKSEPAPKPSVAAEEAALDHYANEHHIPAKDLKHELAELRQNAGDPKKVHPPADPASGYDAEMATTDNHTLSRKHGKKGWCRHSPTLDCDLPVPADVDAKVDATLQKNKGKGADQADKAPAKPSEADLRKSRIAEQAEKRRREAEKADQKRAKAARAANVESQIKSLESELADVRSRRPPDRK